jgi:hypothetical protein
MPNTEKVVLTPEEQQCLQLGMHVLAMLRDLMTMPPTDSAYCCNTMAFKGDTKVHIFLVREDALAEVIEKAIALEYELMSVIPTQPDKVQ